MTEIPLDDILEGLYKLRIRESEKLKIVLELYDLETHQNKLGLDHDKLKTMVKRSIEQNSRIKNFEARNENYERYAVLKNQGTKQREQRTRGDCWQWKATGSVLKETITVSVTMSISVEKWHSRILLRILSCGRTREMRREPEVPEEEVQVVECLDGFARITSKDLAITHFVKDGTLQNACTTRPRVVADLEKSASYAHRQVEEQPSKRSKKNDDKSAVVMLKKNDWRENARQPVVNRDKSHDRSGRPD